VLLLRRDIDRFRKCVISGSLGIWGDEFIPMFDCVIWVDTPTHIRIERLHKRELARFGDRIGEGGDMHEQHEVFIEWAKSYDTNSPPERCRTLHEQWVAKVMCPVLRLDGTKPVSELVHEVERTLLADPG
jgi:adenylate kinase family enzyme